MSSPHWRDPQMPGTSSNNLGGASYCWERQFKLLQPQPTTKNNLCTLPVSGHAPLGINLFAPEDFEHTIEQGPFSSRHLIDGLLREIEQVAAVNKQRRVPWLNWCLPQNLLDSAEVTEVMYHLGRQFHIGDSNNQLYNARFRIDEISESRAALFKGLGFNSLEVQLDNINSSNTQQISRAMSMADDFHFSSFGLRILSPHNALDSEFFNLLSERGRRPDSIALGDFPHTQTNGVFFEALFNRLRELGYRVIGNDCFVDTKHCLALAQNQRTMKFSSHGYNCQNVSDILGIGPGNFSSCGNNRHFNPAEMQSYLTHNFTNRKNTPFLSQSFKPIFDQLLCYHHLDLKYFLDRYDWDLLAVIKQLWDPLQTSDKPFYRVYKSELSLTSTGILNLSNLCDVLLANIESIIASLPTPPCVGKWSSKEG